MALSRMAQVGGFVGKKLLPALRNTMRTSKDSALLEDLIANFGVDAAFGVMQGVMTPGDLREKLIAGTTTAAGGALGGIGAVSALGKFKNNPALRMMGEFGGGAVGDMGGQIVGDALMRAKGGGSTPFEKIQADADQQYRREIEERILAQIGMGGYNQTNLIGMG